MVKTRGVLRLSTNPLPRECRVIFAKSCVALLVLKKDPATDAVEPFFLTDR